MDLFNICNVFRIAYSQNLGGMDCPDLEFVYSDTDSHPNEIAELYSYTEQNEFAQNVRVRTSLPNNSYRFGFNNKLRSGFRRPNEVVQHPANVAEAERSRAAQRRPQVARRTGPDDAVPSDAGGSVHSVLGAGRSHLRLVEYIVRE